MKKLLTLCVMVISLSACESIFLNAADRVKNVQIGMTEKQVVNIMGNDYTLERAQGNMRILSYPVYNSEWQYNFYFVDNRLESFERVQVYKPHDHHHDHSRDQQHVRPSASGN